MVSVAAAVAASWWVAALLALDFLIRGFMNPRISLLAIASRRIVVPLTRLPSKPMYFPPKRFAARVGLVFTITATILFALGAVGAARIVLATLVVFASLECFLDICVGCIVYNTFAFLKYRVKGVHDGRSIH